MRETFDGFKTPIPIKIVLDKVYSSHTQKWPEIERVWKIKAEKVAPFLE